MKNQIAKTLLVERISKGIGATIGLDELRTLLYGWAHKDKDLWEAVRHRDWLYDYEVQDLSRYAGYDLLKMEA